MKAFEYAQAKNEAEAVRLLAECRGAAEVLAGGTDIVGLLRSMTVQPDRLVNIMEVPSFARIEPLAGGGLSIGATVRLEDLLATRYLDDYAGVTQAVVGINSMQLQAQGTLGGEVCQRPRCWYFRAGERSHSEAGRKAAAGDNRHHAIFDNAGPVKFVCSSRMAPALVALEAAVRIAGPGEDQVRVVPLDEFYRTPRADGERENILGPGQLVTHVLLPPAEGATSATYEVRQGAGPDFPLAAAAAALRVENGRVREARIVLGQVAPTPWLSHDAARAIEGRPVDEQTAAAAGDAAVAAATPLSNNGYKVDLARVAVKRAVMLAAGLDAGGFLP